MVKNVDATGYLIIKAHRNQYGVKDRETGLRPIQSAKIGDVRQNRPSTLARDEVLIKVTVQLPSSVFDPISPQALIVVPEELVLDRHQIEATAAEEGADQ